MKRTEGFHLPDTLLSWLQALCTKQLIPSQDGDFLGSLEVPLLERNHHLRNASCSSHCHCTLDFLLFWWSAVYLGFTGIKMARNWFYPHSSHICWESFAQASTRPISVLMLFTFSIVCCSEKAMAPHPSTLAWKIPWTEEPGRLQSMGSWRVRHAWATSLSLFTFTHWRRKWQPTPVFLPGESQGWGSLVGCPLWGRTESDTTEAT